MERKLIELYRKLHDNGAFFFDCRLPFSDGCSKATVVKLGGSYAVCVDTERIETITEETEIVAHECGHVETGSTHKVCSPCDLVEKHEYRANKWAVHEILPAEEIGKVIHEGHKDLWDIAEELGRTEQFVKLAIEIYRSEGIDFSFELSDETSPELLMVI